MRLQACVFPTSLGWFGLLGQEACVWRLTIGHRRSEDAWSDLRSHFPEHSVSKADWHPKLKKRLGQFADGKADSFADIRLRTEHRTEFQQKVLAATRDIGFGETLSYGELAARVGSPNAARAVGAVMASNQIPIIIPCHRVVGSRGELVGFSAPTGLNLKLRLLELEQRVVSSPAKGVSRPRFLRLESHCGSR